MVEMKHTRTYNKLRTPEDLLKKVRDWAVQKGLCREDASVVKVIGTKEQVEELDALVKGSEGKPE